MGSKHPMEVANKLGGNKFEFSIVLRYLIRNNTVKTPSDAIRYLETNNTSIEEILEEMTRPKQPVTKE